MFTLQLLKLTLPEITLSNNKHICQNLWNNDTYSNKKIFINVRNRFLLPRPTAF